MPEAIQILYGGVEDPLVLLRVGQLKVLRQLIQGARTPTQLAKSLGLTPSAVSQLVGRLRNEELIEEVPDPEDRRMKHIQLSEKGRETMSQRSESRIARSQQVLQGMTPESQQELIRSLEALVSVHCERESTNP